MGHRAIVRGLSLFTATALLALLDPNAEAQRPFFNRPLFQRPVFKQLLQPQPEIELVAGEPFGVGRVLAPLPGAEKDADPQALATVTDRGGRVVYPAYESAPLRQLLRDAIAAPRRATIYFLFRGTGPVEFTQPIPQIITPRDDPTAHARLLAEWWKQFAPREAGLLPRADEGPTDVRDYLAWMLGRRLNLATSRGAGPENVADAEGASGALGVITGAEATRKRIMQEVLAGNADSVASMPLPPPLADTAPPLADTAPPLADKAPPLADTAPPAAENNALQIAIEPLAEHVPAECLYVRFGEFANFLWLRQRLDSVRGQLQNFVFERGVDTDENQRLEEQLCAHQGALAKVLGPRVIADVAIIGLDTFQRDGAALGIVFQAKNSAALRFDLTNQRDEALKRHPTANEEKVRFGEITASFVHAPDNRLRSFYLQDGDFHLLTTSRVIAERFVEAGRGKRSLAAAPDFRAARQKAPADQDLTAFVFLSDAFQRNLLSPHYQVEMIRRWRSSSEIEALRLARLAARGEGAASGSVAELVTGGYLPAAFGQRADGSRLVVDGDQASDSLRGRLGTFLPAADTPVASITPAESRRLAALDASYRQNFERFDPVLATVQRTQGKTPDLERVLVDIQAAPLADKHYNFLAQWLGPPLEERLTPVPGDGIAFQASLRGGTLLNTPPHLLFGALRDGAPAVGPAGLGPAGLGPAGLGGLLLQDIAYYRGYLGAWPVPGLLALVPGGGPPDAAGYSPAPLGGVRRVFGPFTLLSFHPEVLEQVAPALQFEPATQPAQIWLRTADLNQSRLSGVINRLGYSRAANVSRGNAHFINSLTRQLRVPPEQALAVAQEIIGAKFADPLGGEYELGPGPTGAPRWTSSKAARPRDQAAQGGPADYQLPALKWLRGVNLEALLQPGYLLAHAEIEMPALEHVSGVEMPALPSLPFSLPGWSKPVAKKEVK